MRQLLIFCKYFLGLCLYLFCFDVYSQSVVPSNLTKQAIVFKNLEIPKNAGYVVNFLPRNYDKKGNVDYTKEVQKVLNEYSFVVMPDFPLLINKDGIKVRSNQTIYFQKQSSLKYAGPATQKENDIIKIYQVKNVKIYNANIVGSKYIKGQKGEWSAGISILDAENISVFNSNIKSTWGDGIFIGSERGRVSKNIIIEGGWIDDARRNGISITSGENVQLNNLLISNTKGTLPECAVDIEPSLPSEELKNIKISNIISFNNNNGAFVANLNSFSSHKNLNKAVSVTVNNLVDYNSNLFLGFSLNPKGSKYTAKGYIHINNSFGNNSKLGFWKDANKSNVKVSLNTVEHNKNGKKSKLKY